MGLGNKEQELAELFSLKLNRLLAYWPHTKFGAPSFEDCQFELRQNMELAIHL